jgi:hypothetical protein
MRALRYLRVVLGTPVLFVLLTLALVPELVAAVLRVLRDYLRAIAAVPGEARRGWARARGVEKSTRFAEGGGPDSAGSLSAARPPKTTPAGRVDAKVGTGVSR